MTQDDDTRVHILGHVLTMKASFGHAWRACMLS